MGKVYDLSICKERSNLKTALMKYPVDMEMEEMIEVAEMMGRAAGFIEEENDSEVCESLITRNGLVKHLASYFDIEDTMAHWRDLDGTYKKFTVEDLTDLADYLIKALPKKGGAEV